MQLENQRTITHEITFEMDCKFATSRGLCLLITVKKLETSLATNQEGAVDWKQIPGAEGRYIAGVSISVEYPYNNLLRLTDQPKVLDGYLSFHLQQHFEDNDAAPSHGVPVICNYRVYGPDRRPLVDSNDGPFTLPYNRKRFLPLMKLFGNSSVNKEKCFHVSITITVTPLSSA